MFSKFARFNDGRQMNTDAVSYDQHVEAPDVESSSIDEHISEDNVGFKMMKNLGWQMGQGLGRKRQGRVDPVGLRPKDNQMGLGFWEMEVKLAQDATEKRRLLETEKEVTPELVMKYVETALKEKERADVVAEMRRDFYCELCDKQYTKYSEYDNHLNSYSHAHKQRLKHLKEFEKGRKFGRKRESKAEISATTTQAASEQRTGGFVPAFIPVGVPRNTSHPIKSPDKTSDLSHSTSDQTLSIDRKGVIDKQATPVVDKQAPVSLVDKQTPIPIVGKQTLIPVVDKQTSVPVVDKQTPVPVADKQTAISDVDKQPPASVAGRKAPPPVDIFDMFADESITDSGRGSVGGSGGGPKEERGASTGPTAGDNLSPADSKVQLSTDTQVKGPVKKSMFLPRVAMKSKPIKRPPRPLQPPSLFSEEDTSSSKKSKETSPSEQTVEETEAAVWQVAQKLHQRFSKNTTSEAYLERCRERIARYKTAQKFVGGGRMVLDTSEFEHGSDQPLTPPLERPELFEDSRLNELEHLKSFVIGFRSKPSDKLEL
jgi:hypothetical protein